MVHTTAMETRNGFHYCYGDKELFSLLLWRQGMVITTAMEIKNSFTYCYGDKEWFTLLLWRQGMGHTIAMEKRNGFHYCYGDKKWFSLFFRDNLIFLLLLCKIIIELHYILNARDSFTYCDEI